MLNVILIQKECQSTPRLNYYMLFGTLFLTFNDCLFRFVFEMHSEDVENCNHAIEFILQLCEVAKPVQPRQCENVKAHSICC